MTGAELTVVGWFATSIIRKVMDMAHSVLGRNYSLKSETAERLTSLEISLPRIQATIEVASKRPITNRGLIKWLDKLKNAAYQVQDVLDDLEATRLRESFKRKDKVTKFISLSGKFVKTLIFSDRELKAFNSAVDEFSRISMEVGDFINLLHEDRLNANIEHSNPNIRETSSYIDPDKIFGRDIEIYVILDMILNQLTNFPKENPDESEVKGNASEAGREDNDQDIGNRKSSVGEQSLVITGYGEGNTSEVGSEGKDQDKSKLISSAGERSLVCIKNWKLPVLPICGLGGVGKTTIAQMVYNCEIITEVFDNLRVWVSVSKSFDEKKIMNEIGEKISNALWPKLDYYSTIKTWDLDTIKNKLIRTIKNRRFFLVLDDIHHRIDESKWSDLYSALGNGAPGSFVLVTTQSERVAKTIGNMPKMISLGVLEPEWFDILFKYYAFGELFSFDRESGRYSISCRNNDARARFNNFCEEDLSVLKTIAKEIAEKLHGLPLAGEVIGKMLHTKLEKERWENILQRDWWEWKDSNISEKILSSLSISYKDLNHELKQCFEFCSIFPNHYVFDKNTLVQMWMAHEFDFVQPNEDERFKLNTKESRLEDVGGDRFDELVQRSFFQETTNDGKYIMHDLIRDLAIAVSPKEKFYHVKNLENIIPSITTHVGVSCNTGSYREGIRLINTNLRTVIMFGDRKTRSSEAITNIFEKSKSLRLMAGLSYIGIKTNPHIYAICRLSHLRFLDLSFSGIEFIPEEFCKLIHLEVLDLRECNLKELPKGMNELVKLRHLYASAEIVSKILGIGKLTNLQELKEFRIQRAKGYTISELGEMNEISGHLLLTNLEFVKNQEEAGTCQLHKKKYLKSLEFEFKYRSRVEREVLQSLKPFYSVEMLTIKGCIKENYLPSWFSNLKCIQVRDAGFQTLPAFGVLPSLEVLSLGNLELVKKVGDEFYGDSNEVFPRLRELTFSEMSRWTTWSDARAGKKSFPRLKRIHLEKCRKIKGMPTNTFTTSVVELKLSKCPEIVNIEPIFPSLTQLSIIKGQNDVNKLSIDCTGLNLLQVMCLDFVSFPCFIGGLRSLVNLRKLEIKWFREIRESFEVEQVKDETSQQNLFLTSLHLDHSYSSTQSLPIAGRLRNLRSLVIRRSPVTQYTEKEEGWFNQLTSLETLEFSECNHLRRLPSTLPLLTKLKKLTIDYCHRIISLPEFGLPPYITELYITRRCSDELVQRCQRDQGDDWWKISHIPHIHIE